MKKAYEGRHEDELYIMKCDGKIWIASFAIKRECEDAK